VNLDAKTVEVDGSRVHLTGKEYAMLELLRLRKGTTLTKEMFLNHLYGGMDEPELKIIDVFICKLRKKLQPGLRRRQLHRDRLGPRLRAARSDE
jgi:two-component system cell cycle response regulator CtrA